MRRVWRTSLLAVLATACAASAQADRSGRWNVAGSETGWGAHAGWVELTTQTSGWSVRGELRFPADGSRGTITGTARDAGRGAIELDLTVDLQRAAPARREVRRGTTDATVDQGALTIGVRWTNGPAGATPRRGSEQWTRQPSPGTVFMKVMTFNIKGFTSDWFSRKDRIGAMIRSESPDIVAMQEVMGLRESHSFQSAEVGRAAGGYHYAFKGARKYSFLGPWMGNAILSKGKVRDGSKRQLTEGSGENTFPRAVTHAEVEARAGRWLHVFSTHLHHRGGQDGEAIRVTQAGETVGFLARHRPGPLLLMGDMNATPDARTLRVFRDAGLRDAWALARSDDVGTNFAGTRRIDYLLVQEQAAIPAVRVLDAWTRGPYVNGATGAMVSDHKAVVVMLEVRLP